MSERVLVVDDDADVREATALLLDTLGYRVLEADGPERAIALLTGDEPPDLLVVDLSLGRGHSGADLGHEAQRLRPGVKVLLISGNPMVAGDLDLPLVCKPFGLDDLRRALAALRSDPEGAAG